MITTADAGAQPGYKVLVTGDATLSRDLTKLSGSDLQKGEAIGIPIALVILVFVFGAIVAALVPVLLSLFAIAVGIAIIAVIGNVSPLSFFAVNMLTFMGLAVGSTTACSWSRDSGRSARVASRSRRRSSVRRGRRGGRWCSPA